MKLITEGMVEHEAASGNVKRKFAPIFKLVNKLGAGADNANTADMLTHKIGELGVGTYSGGRPLSPGSSPG